MSCSSLWVKFELSTCLVFQRVFDFPVYQECWFWTVNLPHINPIIRLWATCQSSFLNESDTESCDCQVSSNVYELSAWETTELFVFPALAFGAKNALSVLCASVFPRSQSWPWSTVPSALPWWSSAQVRWSSAPPWGSSAQVWWSSAPPWWSSAQVRWSPAPVCWSSAPPWGVFCSGLVVFCSAEVVFCSGLVVFCPAVVVFCSGPVVFCSAKDIFCSALVASSPIRSALVGSCPVCAALGGLLSRLLRPGGAPVTPAPPWGGSCHACSALVGSCHACSALGGSCHACSALVGSCSAGSASAPVSPLPHGPGPPNGNKY